MSGVKNQKSPLAVRTEAKLDEMKLDGSLGGEKITLEELKGAILETAISEIRGSDRPLQTFSDIVYLLRGSEAHNTPQDWQLQSFQMGQAIGDFGLEQVRAKEKSFQSANPIDWAVGLGQGFAGLGAIVGMLGSAGARPFERVLAEMSQDDYVKTVGDILDQLEGIAVEAETAAPSSFAPSEPE
jgi:hypothetical protein